MDDRTGKLYESREEALKAGVPAKHIVELKGVPAAIRSISRAVKRIRHEATKRKRAARAKGRKRAAR
jgi:hypothetical protein